MVTHKQIIAAAKQRLRIKDTAEYDALLGSWIYEGVRAARWPTTLVVKNCELTLEDGKAELPSDYSKFVAMQLDCAPIVYYAEDFFSDCNSCAKLSQVGQIIGNTLHIGSAFEASEIILAYTSLNLDGDGMVVIYDEDELSLIYYLCKEFALTFAERYDKMQIREWSNLFDENANYARGLKQRDKFNKDREAISVIMNSLVEVDGNIPGFRRLFRFGRF